MCLIIVILMIVSVVAALNGIGVIIGIAAIYIAQKVNKRLSGATPITPTPSAPKGIDQDGYFGHKSIMAMQKWLGTIQDGEISGQVKSLAKYRPALLSCTYEDTGSQSEEKGE